MEGEILGHRLERKLFTHTHFFFMAEDSLRRGRKDSNRSDFISALVMAAFSFEAYLNFLGENLFSYWEEVDRIPVRNKLSLICKHVQFRPDFGCRPYESLLELWKVRNRLAHASTETVSETRDGAPVEPIAYPETEWEKVCTLPTTERILKDVREIFHDIHPRTELIVGSLGCLEEQGGEIIRKWEVDNPSSDT